MKSIHNPVLPGFHPDPSFLRVGDDYYLATSTFEWFPGVQIHHSRDLIHWRLIGHGLCDNVRLNLSGVPDSGGIWAPALSWHDGQFFLIYTIVHTWSLGATFKDTHNYLVTSKNIEGPWSSPVHLNSSGFDPSLFHDDDGRKWLVNMRWDFRKNKPRFAGIIVQEYDPQKNRLVGPIHTILQKKELIEGPHLYKHKGTYYLMLAQGGTEWGHGIAMARSKSVTGPYEIDPQDLVLTSRDNPALVLQKAGHGQLVETPAGNWYVSHLCSRPVGSHRRCILGRETALQKVQWSKDGWLRLAAGGIHPQVEVPAPEELPWTPWPEELRRDDFDGEILSDHWSSLRVSVDETWLTLRERPGWLRLRGRESPHSRHEQSLVARRLQDFHVVATTCMEFGPGHFTQMAGLICWYDTRTHYYLRVTHDEVLGKVVGIVLSDDGGYDELTKDQIAINDWKHCYLRAEIDHEKLQFSVSPDGASWQRMGPVLDATKLSDDYGGEGLHFTGAFIGLCCQDLGGTKASADFDYFDMKQL